MSDQNYQKEIPIIVIIEVIGEIDPEDFKAMALAIARANENLATHFASNDAVSESEDNEEKK
jgi:hypothetical protein